MNIFKSVLMLGLAMTIYTCTLKTVYANDFTVIRSYDVFANVEQKIPVGTREVCKDYSDTDDEDLIKRGIVGAIIGNQIGNFDGNALLGAVVGVMTADKKLKSACYEETIYEKRIVSQYQHTVIILSDGVKEFEQRIIK